MSDIAKLVFRVLHIASACFVAGNVAGDFLFSSRKDGGYLKLIMGLCAVLAVSGIVNSILLRPSKLFSDKNCSIWKSLVYLKTALFLGLTPIPEKTAAYFGFDLVPHRLTLHFVLIAAILILSNYAKQFRDAKAKSKQS